MTADFEYYHAQNVLFEASDNQIGNKFEDQPGSAADVDRTGGTAELSNEPMAQAQ